MDRAVDKENWSIHDLLLTELNIKYFGREAADARVKAHYNQADAAKDLGVRFPEVSEQDEVRGAHLRNQIEAVLAQPDLGRKSK